MFLVCTTGTTSSSWGPGPRAAKHQAGAETRDLSGPVYAQAIGKAPNALRGFVWKLEAHFEEQHEWDANHWQKRAFAMSEDGARVLSKNRAYI